MTPYQCWLSRYHRPGEQPEVNPAYQWDSVSLSPLQMALLFLSVRPACSVTVRRFASLCAWVLLLASVYQRVSTRPAAPDYQHRLTTTHR